MTRNVITGEYTFTADESRTIAISIANRCDTTIRAFRAYTDTNDDPIYKVQQGNNIKDYWGREYLKATKLYKEFYGKNYDPKDGVVPIE